jgi:cell division protein FtsB
MERRMKKLLFFMLLAAIAASGLLLKVITNQNATIAELNIKIGALQAENSTLTTLVASQSEAIERIKTEAKTQSDIIAKAAVTAAIQRVRAEVKARTILDATAPDDTQELVAWALDQLQEGTL